MTSNSIAAVEPALHGAASAAFNTSRQIGAAVGVAIFGPLLGATDNRGDGFITCVVVGAAATVVALLTALARPAAAVAFPGSRNSVPERAVAAGEDKAPCPAHR
jgi:DHA2 family methylenomycin A resistance protein-like MFS transporter